MFDSMKIEYFIDYINRKIHILDLENFSTMGGLANKISRDFQRKLIEEENLMQDMIEFEWFCYCSNGFVLLYKDYNVVFLNKKLPWLHRPFLDVLEQRSKKY
jgi:hypothetical protein